MKRMQAQSVEIGVIHPPTYVGGYMKGQGHPGPSFTERRGSCPSKNVFEEQGVPAGLGKNVRHLTMADTESLPSIRD